MGAPMGLNDAIDALLEFLGDARRGGRQLWLMGNGGSHANAAHLVTDLASPGGPAVQGWRVAALGSDVSLLLSNSNDAGFEDALAAEVRVFVQPNDSVLAISVS